MMLQFLGVYALTVIEVSAEHAILKQGLCIKYFSNTVCTYRYGHRES